MSSDLASLGQGARVAGLAHPASAARSATPAAAAHAALATLVPYLEKELKEQVLGEALVTASKIKGEYTRANILSALVFHLNGEAQINVLIELLYLNDNDGFSIKLDNIFTLWKEIDFTGFQQNIIPFIKFTAQKNRKEGLIAIDQIVPALVHFRGPEIADELYRAIQDTARWWH